MSQARNLPDTSLITEKIPRQKTLYASATLRRVGTIIRVVSHAADPVSTLCSTTKPGAINSMRPYLCPKLGGWQYPTRTQQREDAKQELQKPSIFGGREESPFRMQTKQ